MKILISVLFSSLALNSPAAAGAAVSFDQKGDLPALSESVKAVPFKAPAGTVVKKAPGFCVFNGATGRLLDRAAFKNAVGAGDAIFAGENHDQLNDHLAQLEVLKALAGARGEKTAVGFEMLNMTLQPVLDEYAAGKISEEEFLLKADWKEEWGFDFNLYKPLFDFIRANKLKALALNLPKKIVSRIARVGLAGLTPEEKRFLPAKVEITKNEAYLKYLRASFYGHGKARAKSSAAAGMEALRRYILGAEKAGMADFTFENYLAAMCAWNETMGARLADFLNANPGYAGAAIAGSGHVIYNAGIPASVASRTAGLRPVSFYPQEAAVCPAVLPAEDAALADNIWYLDHSAPAAGGR